jgi:quercetin dioxygenase-like cupin family protein
LQGLKHLGEEMHDVSHMDRDRIGGRDGSDDRVRTGFGVGAADPERAQELARVDAGENCPGHVLRMRRVTFEPGASIPMHSHKERPEVVLVMEGTLTNTVKGQSPTQLAAGTAGTNGPEVEHEPANETSKPVVLLVAELIKK